VICIMTCENVAHAVGLCTQMTENGIIAKERTARTLFVISAHTVIVQMNVKKQKPLHLQKHRKKKSPAHISMTTKNRILNQNKKPCVKSAFSHEVFFTAAANCASSLHSRTPHREWSQKVARRRAQCTRPSPTTDSRCPRARRSQST